MSNIIDDAIHKAYMEGILANTELIIDNYDNKRDIISKEEGLEMLRNNIELTKKCLSYIHEICEDRNRLMKEHFPPTESMDNHPQLEKEAENEPPF